MSTSPNPIDWKLIAVALLVCYFVPGVVIGALVLTGLQDAAVPYVGQALAAFVAMVAFLVPPFAGGYFAARFARTRPWRHILIVALLGALLSLLAFRTSPRAMLLYVVASVALAAFGGYVRLGSLRPR